MEELLGLSLNLIYTTIGNKTQANLIVKEFLDTDLVLCSNIIDNVNSIFKWDGEVKTENECIVIMKCFAENTNKIIDLIEEIHPYEIPSIFSININQCNSKFLNWIN